MNKNKRKSTEQVVEEVVKNVKVKVDHLASELKTAHAQIEDQEDQLNCTICMDTKRSVLLLPCNHLNLCETCAPVHAAHECPTCRTQVSRRVKVFLS
jgi:hypothetical protein